MAEENLLEQTLRQAKAGILGKPQLQRLRQYHRHRDLSFMREHAAAIAEALAADAGLPLYVAGDEIDGNALREFENRPIITAPLVCMLCGTDEKNNPLTSKSFGFLTEESFLKHCASCHGGYAEYRKRVLYLLEARGSHRNVQEDVHTLCRAWHA